MGFARYGPVAAGDGSPQLAPGFGQLLVHAIATALLLISLAAAGWQFVAWVVEPSGCSADSPVPSTSSPPTSRLASVASATTPSASYHYSARAKLALSAGECPCPHER
jgi:hypothetical protein